MSSYEEESLALIQSIIASLEKEGLVTRTFRRLDFEKQQQVIFAVLEDTAQKPDGVNIKRVAEIAGVSVGSMYQYFPNQEAMVSFAVTLSRRYVEESFQTFESYLTSMPLKECLTAYVETGISWSKEQAAFLKLFARAAYHGEEKLREQLVIPTATAMKKMTLAMLRAAESRGELKEGIDVDTAAGLVNGFLITVCDALLLPHLNYYFQIFEDETDPTPQLHAAVDFVLRSICRSDRLQKKEKKRRDRTTG